MRFESKDRFWASTVISFGGVHAFPNFTLSDSRPSANSIDFDIMTYTTSRVGFTASNVEIDHAIDYYSTCSGSMVCQSGAGIDALDNGVSAMVNVFGMLILEAPKVGLLGASRYHSNRNFSKRPSRLRCGRTTQSCVCYRVCGYQ